MNDLINYFHSHNYHRSSIELFSRLILSSNFIPLQGSMILSITPMNSPLKILSSFSKYYIIYEVAIDIIIYL